MTISVAHTRAISRSRFALIPRVWESSSSKLTAFILYRTDARIRTHRNSRANTMNRACVSKVLEP